MKNLFFVSCATKKGYKHPISKILYFPYALRSNFQNQFKTLNNVSCALPRYALKRNYNQNVAILS